MLTQDEQNYLDKIPTNKKVVMKPYDPKTTEIVEEFLNKIKSIEPELNILHLGAAALKISGQGDIDLSILCSKKSFFQHAENLKKVLGEPMHGISLTLWKFEKGGHEVEICLADPNEPSTARQLKVHKILEQNPKLLKQYEQLKESAANQSYRKYQKLKYEFYNRILDVKDNRKKHSHIKRFFKIFGLVIVGLIVVGFLYEQISEFIDAKNLKPPGQMIQVGNHKMHIYCTGENINGSATVILEAGGGDNYTTWHRVQPKISNYTKVCSYDRAGLGFSEATSDQRTNDDVVNELETLLKNANVNGPYIMVGHSTGGFYTRLFTAKNRSQVVGLIQIDPSVEQMASFENDPTPLIMTAQSDVVEFLFRIGVARIVMHLDPKIANIDPDIANIEIAFKSTMLNNKNKYPDGYKTFDNIQEIESASNFGDLPVVVYSADQSEQQAVASFGQDAVNWHSDLANKLSTNSKYIMVQNSSHYIQQDQPQIIIDQVKSLVY